MKILFGEKYYGKDTSEVPSGFLIWVIESYQEADWSLVNAAKQELSARLRLEWEPPTDKEVELTREITKLRSRIEWYKYIIRSHGINLNYFLSLGKLFSMSMFFRTQREGSFRLPDAFADAEVQKAPFNIFTVSKPE